MSTLALYVEGDIYPSGTTKPAAVVAAITGPKLTTPILSLFHVNCSSTTCPNSGSPPGSQDGDIAFNDTLVVSGGKYVGDPTWPGIVHSLRAGNVKQIFASVVDYARIGQLIAKYGTGPQSPLYQNFACLKATLGLDGVDLDDEDSYEQNTIVPFTNMLTTIELTVTFCPYTNQEFWKGCLRALPGKVAWLNLQCYAGGKSNNPGDWTDMGVPVVAGVGANCCCPQTTCSPADVRQVYTLWTTGSVNSACWTGSVGKPAALAGGFIWSYAEIAGNLPAYVDAMDAGLHA